MNHQYDVIVIGTGEKTKSTVKALGEQGQQVMYIELSPEMLATMVCHHPKKNSSSSKETDAEKEQKHMNTKIHLQKQTIQTSAGETITYTFHVEESVEITEVDPIEIDDHLQEDLHTDHAYLYQPSSNHQEKMEPFEFDLVEDFTADQVMDAEVMDETITYYEEEPPDTSMDEADHILYEIDHELIEDEHETIDFTEEVTPAFEEEAEKEEQNTVRPLSHSLKPSSLSQQKEREHVLREKLIRRKGKMETSNLLMGDYQDKESYEEQPESVQYDQQEKHMDRSAFLHSVLNKPSYTPRESRLRKRLGIKTKSQPSSEIDKTNNDNSLESQPSSQPSSSVQNKKDRSEQQKVYSFEPFSSRRRARAQKKSRVLTNVERLKSNANSVKPIEEQPDTPSQVDFEHHNLPFQQAMREESSSIQSINVNELSPLNAFEATQTDSDPSIQTEPTVDLLKKDTIELEDPYGGYNSLEDFLPPYSQNNRKRQEIDEIEKRKIALRGLHNLINNLG